MTKREAAIVSAYTGIAIGNFADIHDYIEEKLRRPVMTHELARLSTWDAIKNASRNDFCSISITEE